MNIEQVPICDIKPYENNAKKHTDAQIEEIAKSIHDFGFNQNLVIDKNNECWVEYSISKLCTVDAAGSKGNVV